MQKKMRCKGFLLGLMGESFERAPYFTVLRLSKRSSSIHRLLVELTWNGSIALNLQLWIFRRLHERACWLIDSCLGIQACTVQRVGIAEIELIYNSLIRDCMVYSPI